MALCPCMSFHHGTTAHMRANTISITNKLNTAPRAGSRRAEHRTLLATCVKFGRGEEMREERQRIHENTPGVFHQFLIFWESHVLWHILNPRVLALLPYFFIFHLYFSICWHAHISSFFDTNVKAALLSIYIIGLHNKCQVIKYLLS